MEEDFDVRPGDEVKYYEPAPEYKTECMDR